MNGAARTNSPEMIAPRAISSTTPARSSTTFSFSSGNRASGQFRERDDHQHVDIGDTQYGYPTHASWMVRSTIDVDLDAGRPDRPNVAFANGVHVFYDDADHVATVRGLATSAHRSSP